MKIKNQLLAAALCCFAIAAQAEKLTSPDGKLVMDFNLNSKGKLSSNPVHWDLN